MPVVSTHAVVEPHQLERILQPRRGFVAETPQGDGSFALAEGPFRSYRRRVLVEPAAGERLAVRQEVEYHLALPFWRFLFAVPVRRELARLEERPAQPWWAPPERLDARGSEVLGLVAAAAVITGFLATLMTQTATFAAEEFDTSNTALGAALAVTRSAALLALPVAVLADRRGRRRVATATLLAGPVVAATGALAPSLPWLTVTQTATRAVAIALGLTLSILVAEEMPPSSRAYAVSLVSMAGALGVGLVLFALPLADVGEGGWRLVYLLALAGLPLAVRVARRLPESRRFGVPHAEVPVAGHGARFRLLAVSGLLLAVFGAPASQFQNEFLRDDLGYSGGRIALFAILTNVPGAIGVVVGGRLADVRGRRPVAAVGLVGGTVATVLMFSGSGWPIWLWSVVGAVVGSLTVPALGVYGPELFPTSLRGRLNGVITVVALAGSVIGLLAVGALSDRWRSFGPAFALMAVGPVALAALVLVAYPETAHRTLEELNPEDEPPPASLPAAG